MKRTTLTLERPGEVYITVEMIQVGLGWIISGALDEMGKDVKRTVTPEELGDLILRAESGEDETGY